MSGKASKASTNRKWYVQHNYHDHSQDIPLSDEDFEIMRYFASPGEQDDSLVVRFPFKLHVLLLSAESEGYKHIISWQVHDRAFKIHKDREFAEKLLPVHFKHNNLDSFHRQLNVYGFSKITRGPDKGAYYHELFLRGKYFLARGIARTRVKGTFVKGSANPSEEPNFYSMPSVNNDSTSLRLLAAQKDHVCAKDEAACLSHRTINNDAAFGVKDFNGSSAVRVSSDASIPEASFVHGAIEFFSSWQDLKICASVDEFQKEGMYNGEDIFSDISIEDDLLHPNQHYSFLEYVDTYIVLQMVIDKL